MRRVSNTRRTSLSHSNPAPTRRKASNHPAQRKASNAPLPRQPLAPDMSFGNSASTARPFRRVSDNSPGTTLTGSLERQDENRPPAMEPVTKEALVGRRAYAKAVDGAFQENYAQTAHHAKREALAQVAQAWNRLDEVDPEGGFHFLKLIIDKVQRYVNLPRPCTHAHPGKRPRILTGPHQ